MTPHVITTPDYVKASVHLDPETGLVHGTTVHGHHRFEAPLFSHIEGNLYQGGCDPKISLPENIIHVVSLYTDEWYAPTANLKTSLEVVMFDSVSQDLSEIDRVARWTLECLETGPTLVMCHMGLNRSGVVVARTLMLQGMSAEEAIALERERRSPAALNNPAFERWLLENPVTSEVAT